MYVCQSIGKTVFVSQEKLNCRVQSVEKKQLFFNYVGDIIADFIAVKSAVVETNSTFSCEEESRRKRTGKNTPNDEKRFFILLSSRSLYRIATNWVLLSVGNRRPPALRPEIQCLHFSMRMRKKHFRFDVGLKIFKP